MELKIGQVFEVKGNWYQFVECNGTCCNNCVFNQGLKCMYPDISMQCARFFRTDGKNGHAVLLDAIGGEYKQGDAIFRDYRCQTKPVTTDRRVYINNSDSDISLIISIKIHDLVEKFEQNKEDMEENNNAKHSNSENIGKNLKPFDLQAAKSGKPVCTRSGKPARIICFDRVDNTINKPIVALVTHNDGQEYLSMYHLDGRYNKSGDDFDLMMLPEKKEGWVNVSKFSTYDSKEEALSHKTYDIIDTIKVSWEE